MGFSALDDSKITGSAFYFGIGLGYSFPFVDWGSGILDYSQITPTVRYGIPGPGDDAMYAKSDEIAAYILGSLPYVAEQYEEEDDTLGLLLVAGIAYARYRNTLNVDRYIRAFNGIQIDSYE